MVEGLGLGFDNLVQVIVVEHSSLAFPILGWTSAQVQQGSRRELTSKNGYLVMASLPFSILVIHLGTVPS